jgi:glycosyltransferase involved in cell wall biosynthesis
MFGWEFPPYNSGGLGTACHGLTHALADMQVQITFVLPRNLGASSPTVKMVYADTKTIKFEVWNSLLKGYATSESYKEEFMKSLKEGYAQDLLNEVQRYALAGKEIARKEHHDIIHAHDWLSFQAGIAAKNESGKPLVLHVHATEFDRSSFNAHPEIYRIENESLKQADRVVAVSSFTKDLLNKYYDVPASKIDVVHNGINHHEYQRFEPNVQQLKRFFGKIVLFAGRLTVQKGPDYFLKAAQRVLSYDDNVTFVVSGAGDMEHQIMHEAVRMGISHKIFFTGFLRGHDLHTVFQAADLYVMPSVSEPFGIAALEALANDTPILISRQSGVSEILTHALKVDFWDTEEMANKILSLLNYPSLYKVLRENGKRESERYSWSRSAEQCLHVYKQLLA